MDRGALEVEIVVAMTRQRLMGRDGDMPWHVPEDLAHFKAVTKGGVIIMGRLTWQSLGGKPLPRRRNIVLSRSMTTEEGGPEVRGSLQDALAVLRSDREAGRLDPDTKVFVIGGAGVYRQALDEVDPPPLRLHITWMPNQPVLDGDVLFPRDEDWILQHYEIEDERAGETEGVEFVTYGRGG